MNRTVIIVSPHFPPSSLASVHRVRHLAAHLPSAGWEPIVVCVDDAYYEEPLDPELAACVSHRFEIIKTTALPSRMMRPLGIGDLGLRAWCGLKSAVMQLASTRKIDAVVITGAPFYPMLLAAGLRKLGIPVVLDFQDPWVSHWGARQSAFSKAGISHRLATWLEPRALRSAHYVTSVSDRQNVELRERYSWLDAGRMAAIPIGYDGQDFAHLRRSGVCAPAGVLATDRINLSFVGTFTENFIPTTRVLFSAIRRLLDRRPELTQKLRLNFVGTSVAHPSPVLMLAAAAAAAGVSQVVYEAPQRLPYLEALAALAQSDVLLLLGSDEPHYTASRIFPALLSGRPYLAVYHAASSAHDILLRAGGGLTFGFQTVKELVGLKDQLGAALERLVTAPASFAPPNPDAIASYSAKAVARKFGTILNEISAVPRQSASMAAVR